MATPQHRRASRLLLVALTLIVVTYLALGWAYVERQRATPQYPLVVHVDLQGETYRCTFWDADSVECWTDPR